MPFTRAFFKQIRSPVHQFVYSKMFPKMRSSIFYLPKDKGGLGLLDAEVQQQVFQFRYIKAMVNNSISMLNVVPSFLVNLLSDSLQITYEAPYATLPLLFAGCRHPKQPKILSPSFSLLFKAFDACFPNRTSASLWPQIPPAVMCLSLPVSEVLFINTDYSGTPFKFSKHLLSLKVSDFFWFDHSDRLLHYRFPGDCLFPGLFRKVKKAITAIKLLAHRYFAFQMGLIQYSTFTVDEVYLTRTHINSSSIAIQPFLTSIFVIADKFLPFCSNLSIRHQILRHTAITFHGHFYNPSFPSRG